MSGRGGGGLLIGRLVGGNKRKTLPGEEKIQCLGKHMNREEGRMAIIIE